MADKKIKEEVEIELKKETPNAYPFMEGLSPITHMRRYLKGKKIKDIPSEDESLYEENNKIELLNKGGEIVIGKGSDYIKDLL